MKSGKKLIVVLTMLTLIMSCCLAGCGKSGTKETNKPAHPEMRTITDMGGRKVTVPTKIDKVFCVSPVGTILVYTLDPDLLVGWNYDLRPGEKEYILPKYQSLPNLGGWYAKATCNTEELLKIKPDVILSMAYLDAEQVDKIEQQTGLPVVMIDGDDLMNLDKAYEFAGKLLNMEERANELSAYCRETAKDVQAKANTISDRQRVKVYYAEGAAGLETDPKGSNHTATLDIVGGVNVADVAMKGGMGMTPVSLEQVLAWNPDIIISWNDTQGGYYSKMLTDSKWQSITAVNNKKVYAVPSGPFNWFDRPPSVNRILGLKWLGNLLYPDVYNYDMAKETREFYKKFYHYDLSDQEIESLLKDCGGI
ncbi:ABC transporter periplasmic binding domain [Syntrophomonas zehnderi OL-4]|uniref:ABC transporter periplasmic binding domain n=1 Tax=Syntrophomonas zehnderi OL-4 TaxID=690567 RepID=A0A0E3W3I0_9FIRM|nr:ABC transporter substrate-binding protein [Syntrophomonas zehnderi]CFX84263.1 ABC transporter periplasmic binding domain [Syntrophomonas zehnderi OL-4]